MTISDWVTIVVIMSNVAVVVSTLALYVSNRNLAKLENAKLRMNRPDQTPELIQPKTLLKRIGGWLMHFLESPWQLPLVLILTNLFTLVLELRSTTPITRRGFTESPRRWLEFGTGRYSYS